MQKKLPRRCLTGLKIGFWLMAWNIELTLGPSLQVNPKRYSGRKYVLHCFWNGEKSWWDSKQNKCLWGRSRPKDFLKKMLWQISQNSQENICTRISFLLLSCQFCGICKKTFFAEQCWSTDSDYSSISSSEGTIGKRNCNYDTQTKAYVLIWAGSVSY